MDTTSLEISSDPDALSCVQVGIVEDTLVEAKESFDLMLTRDGLDVAFGQRVATITIQDDDGECEASDACRSLCPSWPEQLEASPRTIS